MADVANSRARLKSLLRRVQYPDLATLRLESAHVADLLRVLNFALLRFSRAVAAFVQSHGFDLFGKTDARFVDAVFRLLRDAFKYFPPLSAAQFLSEHHTTRKLDVVSDVLQLVLAKHDESARLERRQAAVWTEPKQRSGAPSRVENHLLPPAPPPNQPPSHAAAVLKLLHSSSSNSSSKKTKALLVATEAPSEPIAVPAHTRKVAFAQRDGGAAVCEGDSSPRAAASSPSPVQDSKACACAPSTKDLAETLAALSSQIAGLSDAFMAKISTVEGRLGRLETQMHALSTLSDARWSAARATATTTDTGDSERHREDEEERWSGSARSEAASRLRLHIESCAWPPKPSVFARP
ncbi:hypothetical protein PybrP1_007525 [[Pythium] brassicae (nom. inval.)]|nr:hypothetical protein PybrP1_007525 [[Pythium] brassicae (nom. inval.)]